MRRYKPIEQSFTVPHIPENLMDAIAAAAAEGVLFQRPVPVRIEILDWSPVHLAIRVLDEAEVLTLRFDTLEVWRVGEQAIRFRVAYRGWFRHRMRDALDIGFMHGVFALIGSVFILLIIFLPESLAFASNGGGHEDRGDETRPKMRLIKKRIQEIAEGIQ